MWEGKYVDNEKKKKEKRTERKIRTYQQKKYQQKQIPHDQTETDEAAGQSNTEEGMRNKIKKILELKIRYTRNRRRSTTKQHTNKKGRNRRIAIQEQQRK